MSNESKYKLDFENKKILGSCYEDQFGGVSFSMFFGKIQISKAKSGKWYAYFVDSILKEPKEDEPQDGQPISAYQPSFDASDNIPF